MEKFPKIGEALPEVMIANGDKKYSYYLSDLVKKGCIKKVMPKIYTSNLSESEEVIVRRNLFLILGRLFPEAVVSHRSAIEMKPTVSGDFFLTYKYTKKITLPGLIIHLLEGQSGQPEDTPFVNGLFIACPERAFLENLQTAYQKKDGGKCLPQSVIEERLEKVIRINGEAAINALRDKAKVLSERLGMTDEYARLDKLIGALLSTRDANILTSPLATARVFGEPYDPHRYELFQNLFTVLNNDVFPSYPENSPTTLAYRNFAFFESYFSNYIEGTEFTIDDAKQIIETNLPLPARNEDSHDMLGTFAIVSDRREMSIVPNTPDELIELLQARHKKLLSARPEKHPGLFKMQNNRAGNSLFVDYELVKGTLKKGFDFYRALRSPFAKAVFMLFMVSEIHPFDDGNGRVSRIMMNAELTHANETKIIIPTVFRTDYLDALRKFTRQSDPTALIRAMSRVHRFSAQLQTENFETLQLQLERANAFSDSEDKILRF